MLHNTQEFPPRITTAWPLINMNQQKHLRVPTKEYCLTADKHVPTDLNGPEFLLRNNIAWAWSTPVWPSVSVCLYKHHYSFQKCAFITFLKVSTKEKHILTTDQCLPAGINALGVSTKDQHSLTTDHFACIKRPQSFHQGTTQPDHWSFCLHKSPQRFHQGTTQLYHLSFCLHKHSPSFYKGTIKFEDQSMFACINTIIASSKEQHTKYR